ncbi:uncharacterized protein ACA1_370550 [Acanthamoeba castellanii str. Neff]|uniref:Uncharacterized protein n=1 Tax=Acanthamoeba castellanii (strain ATCC 30010 / Neff) TaxID=1257118 RepID=L8H1L4_ACACF|nr:uncharacterized protein ACA1_370550 [Acanthamoeba castellanii str. Neff]ELR18281.1 hypothetical protein ACA1_370550 [Acanthamoeba castellanii str. Neff]
MVSSTSAASSMLKEIGMSQLGDQKRVLVTAAKGKAAYKAGLITAPAPPLLPIPPAPYSYLSPPATPSFSPPSPSNTTIHIPHKPKRCQKFCHQLLFSSKHTCTKEEECGSLASCSHINLHPEEKKQHIKEKKVKKAEVKRQKKEEDAVQKAERDALLHLQPEPIWDSWFKIKLKHLIATHPDLYSTMKGTCECCNATAKLAQ